VVGIGRIDSSRNPAIIDQAAGPTTGLIMKPRPRGERDGVLLPAKQVNRAHVAPMDCAVYRRHRVVLKEDVIAAVDPAETVRIVDPSARRPDVQSGEAGISHAAKVPDSVPVKASLSASVDWLRDA
jgi:hypothetical protein